jgi:dTDP-glucose 4,6-dehydratase
VDVVRTLCAIVDRLSPGLPHAPCERLIQFVPDRPGHDRRYAIDSGKIERELGWQPRQTFESGLEATVRWYMEHGEWIRRVTTGAYRRERLGLGGGTAAP